MLGRACFIHLWWVCGSKTEILQTNSTGQKIVKNLKNPKKSIFLLSSKTVSRRPNRPPKTLWGPSVAPGSHFGPFQKNIISRFISIFCDNYLSIFLSIFFVDFVSIFFVDFWPADQTNGIYLIKVICHFQVHPKNHGVQKISFPFFIFRPADPPNGIDWALRNIIIRK